jgi:uncharacterized UBP type Zn finger protein
MFSVRPKTDCPHVAALDLDKLLVDCSASCTACACESLAVPKENWLCLSCSTVLCSRYERGHMKDHCEKQGNHPIVLSFSDGSIFCYDCVDEQSGEKGTYIASQVLRDVSRAFELSKFGE